MRGINAKRTLVVAVSLVTVGLGALGVWLRVRPAKETQLQEQTARKLEPVNAIPVRDRPFIEMVPRADGREVRITVTQLNESDAVEYELEYQAGTLLQGAFGKIDFSSETAPVIRNILLGSCSAGGKCSYHEDVNGGTLLLRYINNETTALKAEWNFQLMRNEAGRFSSRDAKFSFDVGKHGLPAATFAIIAQTMGLPGPVDGEIVSGPYSITFPKAIAPRTKEIITTLRIDSQATEIRLFGWSGDGWTEYEAQQSGKTLEAMVDRATTFVAVHAPSSP